MRTLIVMLVLCAPALGGEKDEVGGEWQVFKSLAATVRPVTYKVGRDVRIIDQGRVTARSVRTGWDSQGRMIALFRLSAGREDVRRLSERDGTLFVERWESGRGVGRVPDQVWWGTRRRPDTLEEVLKGVEWDAPATAAEKPFFEVPR